MQTFTEKSWSNYIDKQIDFRTRNIISGTLHEKNITK